MSDSRRDFLIKLSAGLSLSKTMFPNLLWAQAGTAKKLIILSTVNGTEVNDFFPSGNTVTSGKILAPLAEFNDTITLVDGLQIDGSGVHSNNGRILTGSTKAKGDEISIDQVIAQKLSGGVKFPSMNLASWCPEAEGAISSRPDRYKISSGGPGNGGRIEPIGSPLQAYNKYLAGVPDPVPGEALPPTQEPGPDQGEEPGDGGEQIDKATQARKKSLEILIADYQRISASLHPTERKLIEAHIDGLKELDRTGAFVRAPAASALTLTAPADMDMYASTSGSENIYKKRIEHHLDIMIAGLASNVSNVATLTLGGSHSDAVYSWLTSKTHHGCSHNSNYNERVMLDKQHAEWVKYLIVGLQKYNLYRDSLIIWVNDMHVGETHTATRMPFLLAGGAGGAFRTGRVVKSSGSHNKLWVDVARAFGVQLKDFGSGGGAGGSGLF